MPVELFEKQGLVSEYPMDNPDHTVLFSVYEFHGYEFFTEKFVDEFIRTRHDLNKIDIAKVIEDEPDPLGIEPTACSKNLIKTQYGIGELIFSYHENPDPNKFHHVSAITTSREIAAGRQIHVSLHETLLILNDFDPTLLFYELDPSELGSNLIKSGNVNTIIDMYEETLSDYSIKLN